MKCDQCGSSEQVVSTQDGKFCRNCYRGYKSGKSIGRAVLSDNSTSLLETVTCGNCFTPVTKGSNRCFMCGSYLTAGGRVMRIGGHPDC